MSLPNSREGFKLPDLSIRTNGIYFACFIEPDQGEIAYLPAIEPPMDSNRSGQFAPQFSRFWPELKQLRLSNHSNRFRVATEARAAPVCQNESSEAT